MMKPVKKTIGSTSVPVPVQQKPEPEQDAEETVLHPQLQEILQYLADDEHVSIVKTSYLTDIQNKLGYLTELVQGLQRTLQHQSKPVPAPAPLPVPAPALSNLIKSYAPSNGDASAFNEYFDATFVFNHRGQAKALAQYMKRLGLRNCHVIDAAPPGCQDTKRVIYQILEILNACETEGYERVNILADIVAPHKKFFEAINAQWKDITDTEWDLLQYCCIDTASTETNSTVAGLVPCKSNNTLAFAIHSRIFTVLRQNCLASLGTKEDVPLLNIKRCYMTSPNLFSTTPGTNYDIIQ